MIRSRYRHVDCYAIAENQNSMAENCGIFEGCERMALYYSCYCSLAPKNSSDEGDHQDRQVFGIITTGQTVQGIFPNVQEV